MDKYDKMNEYMIDRYDKKRGVMVETYEMNTLRGGW